MATATTDIVGSKAEQLAEQEARIESAVAQAFITAGQALRVIRDGKLYGRDGAGFETFEAYCLVRWNMHRQGAHYLIQCAAVMESLSVKDLGQLPRNAWVAHELTPLLPAPPIMGNAWQEAVESAPKDEGRPIITAKHVKAIVRKYIHEADGETIFPGEGYRVVYADPPWKYNDELIKGYGAVVHHYPPMTIDELSELADDRGVPLHAIIALNAVLFLWVTSPLLEDSFKVLNAWGFDYKTSFVWDKVAHNYGHYNSVRHEFVLVCTRGSCTPDSKTLHDSVLSIERTKKHSQKPDRFREIIDEMYPPPDGEQNDRIELFAREAVTNWDGYGNQLAS